MDIQTGQPVHPVSAMARLEQQLSCPICLDMFTKPVVILPCQHNLCRTCANELYESKNLYHYSGGTFRCPTCRFEVVLDRRGVHGLQRNLLVENIIDIYKLQQERQGDDAEGPPLKDKDTKELKCKEHEDEYINIYCISCQTPTCSMCKVFGQHKDCEVEMLPAVYETQKNELRSATELLVAGNGCIQGIIAQMDDTCKLIQENGEQKKRQLGESFNLLHVILEERKGQLLEQISRVEQEKVSALRNLAEQYKQQLQLSNLMQEKIVQNMQSCSTVEFLLTAKHLQEEARLTVRAAHLTRPKPGYESMEQLNLHTQRVEALLTGMDFSRG